MTAFVGQPDVARVLGLGDTKASVLLTSGLQADLRLVEAASKGAALQYFTGSKSHNIALRDRALSRGMRLNEYGLFLLDGDSPRRRNRGGHLRGARSGSSFRRSFASSAARSSAPKPARCLT